MQKKKMLLIIIIPVFIIFIGWFFLFRNTDDVSTWIDVEIPAGSKYITKDKNIGGFPPDGIDYFVVRIPLAENIEFITRLERNQWTAYNEKEYDFYFNNWLGNILNRKIPLPGIESGWITFIDNRDNSKTDISHASKDELRSFVFAVYDPDSYTLHVLEWLD